MQEYLDRREKLDELMRNAFFSLAKAKCEKINPTLSVPKTTSAARKIMVRDHRPRELKEQRVSHTRHTEAPDEIKDFIQSLAMKYGCDIDDNKLLCEKGNQSVEELYLPGLWNECKVNFSTVLSAIEDITQIVYKLYICMERHKVILD